MLVVRYWRDGDIASPTTTAGYVTAALVPSLAGCGLLVAGALRETWKGELVLGAAFIGLYASRALVELWAWLAASPGERKDFRLDIANAKLARMQGRRPGR